jgi:hypothetical protein
VGDVISAVIEADLVLEFLHDYTLFRGGRSSKV